MRAWMELGVLLLCGTAAGAGLAMAEPLLELQPTPQDPAALAACFDDAQLGLLEKLNRIDRDRLPKLPSLVQPRDWSLDELELAPLPARLDWAAELAKIVIVHQPLQAFGAYEAGALVHWGPVSTGAERSPTPGGLYFLNWRSAGGTAR